MKKLRGYFEGVQAEMKKVSFPSWPEVWQMTSLVISVSVLLAVTIGVLDFGFRNVISWLVG